MRKFLIAVFAFGCFTAPIVCAAAPSAAVRAACLNDARKFCAPVIQNDEARRRCMAEHAAELSSGCKAALAQGAGGQGKSAQQQGTPANVSRCVERCAAASPDARSKFKCHEACVTGTYQRPSGY
jgi:hypothetical protein